MATRALEEAAGLSGSTGKSDAERGQQWAAIAAELAQYRIARLTPPGHVHGEAPPDFELVAEPTVGLVDLDGTTCRVWVGTLAGVEVACLVARVSVPEGTDASAIDEMLFRAVPPEALHSIGADQVTVVESPLLMREIDKLVPEVRAQTAHGESAAETAVRVIREARELLEDTLNEHRKDLSRGLVYRLDAFLGPWQREHQEAEIGTHMVKQITGGSEVPLIEREVLLETAEQLREAGEGDRI